MSDSIKFTKGGDRLRWISVPGRGEPVVYIHGLGCHGGASWTDTAVRTGRPGVIVDLPGHGRSDRPTDFGYTLPEMAEGVGRAIEAVTDGGPVDLVSHSLGGTIAIVLAAARPDLVRRSVLVEPAIDPVQISPRDIAAYSEDAILNGGWEQILAAELDWRRCEMGLADPIAIRRLAVALCDALAGTLHALLRDTRVPTTLVRGELRSYDRADEFLLAGILDVVVENAQHFVMLDQPDAFQSVLRAAFGKRPDDPPLAGAAAKQGMSPPLRPARSHVPAAPWPTTPWR